MDVTDTLTPAEVEALLGRVISSLELEVALESRE